MLKNSLCVVITSDTGRFIEVLIRFFYTIISGEIKGGPTWVFCPQCTSCGCSGPWFEIAARNLRIYVGRRMSYQGLQNSGGSSAKDNGK